MEGRKDERISEWNPITGLLHIHPSLIHEDPLLSPSCRAVEQNWPRTMPTKRGGGGDVVGLAWNKVPHGVLLHWGDQPGCSSSGPKHILVVERCFCSSWYCHFTLLQYVAVKQFLGLLFHVLFDFITFFFLLSILAFFIVHLKLLYKLYCSAMTHPFKFCLAAGMIWTMSWVWQRQAELAWHLWPVISC